MYTLLTQSSFLTLFGVHYFGALSEMAGPSGQSPLMQFNVRQHENSFKISLKSPNLLRTTSQNGSQVGPAANVTSTNPKTPSPSTNDVSAP